MNIPAVPYLTIVKQFALAKGMKFFTWADVVIASKVYLETAKHLN